MGRLVGPGGSVVVCVCWPRWRSRFYMLVQGAFFGPPCTDPLVHLSVLCIIRRGHQETIWIKTKSLLVKCEAWTFCARYQDLVVWLGTTVNLPSWRFALSVHKLPSCRNGHLEVFSTAGKRRAPAGLGATASRRGGVAASSSNGHW